MRVLLAEDDVMIGEVIQKSLKENGYATDWVINGKDVKTSLCCHNYGLVLLDLGLPEIDGMDCSPSKPMRPFKVFA